MPIATIGENMNLRRSAIRPSTTVLCQLMSTMPLPTDLGKLGVLVAIETDWRQGQAARAIGRQIAMHVAATNPLASGHRRARSGSGRPRASVIFSDQARASGKPENIIEKMVEGRLRKFYEEVYPREAGVRDQS
jgi:elongation factor Ts